MTIPFLYFSGPGIGVFQTAVRPEKSETSVRAVFCDEWSKLAPAFIQSVRSRKKYLFTG
jgi:hypothetical protein